MRVLFLNHAAELGGAERSLLELIEGLPRQVEAEVACPAGELASRAGELGIRVHGLRPARSPYRRRAGGLGLRVVGPRLPGALAAIAATAWRVSRLARRDGFALVHANSLRAGVTAGLAARLGGPPAVVHARDVVLGPDARLVLGAIRRTAAVTIANSAATARRLRAAGIESVVVPGFADPARFDPADVHRDEARAELGLAAGELALVVVGRLAPEKGQAEALRALALLGRPRARLLVAGSRRFSDRANAADVEAYADRLVRLARELGIADRVSFLGEREDMPRVLAAADVLLAPSHDEPFGRAVAEGMAMGLPVIAGNRGGPAELIEDEVSGLLRDPERPEIWAPAIARLADDPGLRRRLGLRAQERIVGSFDRAAHVRGVIAAYAVAGSASDSAGAPSSASGSASDSPPSPDAARSARISPSRVREESTRIPGPIEVARVIESR
ncbi:MAG: L-malate glycosyltransferase [Solirubrobacterales bacterium]|jgi:glycosyltransferase involved in cell wall biosynthesis|nr:L-malate glycosyltransferase [Solirubrobacterales bacterium]